MGRSTTLAARTYELIREEILSGRLVPGSLVSAGGLAASIGVSRTPVREALLQLERAGMVRIEKNRGATILETTIEDLVQVFQLLMLTEVPLAMHAARVRTTAQLDEIRLRCEKLLAVDGPGGALLTLDRDIHLAIAEVSGNARAVALIGELRGVVAARGITADPADVLGLFQQCHIELIAALERKDADGAAGTIRRHIVQTARLLDVAGSRMEEFAALSDAAASLA